MDSKAERVKEVNEMITDARNEKSKLKSTLEKIMEILISIGMAYREWIPLHRLGVHPDNRFGAGLLAADVQKLLNKIINAGWSWGECAAGICFEIAHGVKGKVSDTMMCGARVDLNHASRTSFSMFDLRLHALCISL